MKFKQLVWWKKAIFCIACIWMIALNALLIICGVKLLHKHEWKRIEGQAATCTQTGYEQYECKCGEEKTQILQALGHNVQGVAGKKATCREVGWRAYLHCIRCEYTTYEEIPSLGHRWEEGEDGIVCARCEREKEETDVDEHAHLYELDFIIRQPTCVKTGLAEYVCECGERVEIVVTRLGHTGSDAICGEEGECIRCQALYVASLTHRYKNDECIYCHFQKPNIDDNTPSNDSSSNDSSSNENSSENSSSDSNGEEENEQIEEAQLQFEYENGGYTCTGFESGKESAFVVIPALYAGEPVTKIAAGAFRYHCKIVRLTIGENIASIGNNAFLDCYNLTEIYNLSSLPISIGEVDYGCVGLYAKEVYDTLSKESKIQRLTGGFITYTEGETVTLLGYDESKKKITLPQGITRLCRYVFTEGLEELTICSSVKEIGARTFEGITTLKKVYFENANGWKLQGQTPPLEGLEDEEIAADYLTGRDESGYWKKSWKK